MTTHTQLTFYGPEEPIKDAKSRLRIMEKIDALSAQLIATLKKDAYIIHSPEQASTLITTEMSCLEKEQLRVITLNTRNRVLNIHLIYQGSLNQSAVRIGELFKPAIIDAACAIVVAHNHPSGDPTPSPDDIAVTRAIIEAGKLLDIEVLDHLVIAGGSFVSLKQRQLAFKECPAGYQVVLGGMESPPGMESNEAAQAAYNDMDELLSAICAYSLKHPSSPIENQIHSLTYAIFPLIDHLFEAVYQEELNNYD